MPSLVRAQRTQSKAARVGFDWPDARAAWDKVREEVDEAGEAIAAGDHGAGSAKSLETCCFRS